MSFGSNNNLFYLLTKKIRFFGNLSDLLLLVVIKSSLLLFFASLFSSSSSFFSTRMRLRLHGLETGSMQLKSERLEYGVNYFGFLQLDRCFFLFLFFRSPLT